MYTHTTWFNRVYSKKILTKVDLCGTKVTKIQKKYLRVKPRSIKDQIIRIFKKNNKGTMKNQLLIRK